MPTSVLPAAPAKAPEVLSNEIIPTVASPLAVVPVETVTGEKLVEQPAAEIVAMPEKVEVVPEAVNEIIPVIGGELLDQAASDIVVSGVPSVTQAALVIEPVETAVPTAAASAPVKQTSEEEEGLIEGIVNTFIGEGKSEAKKMN